MEFVHHRGVPVPVLGFGTFRMKGREGTKAVRQAIEAGYRHLDTAEEYGNEDAVAQGIREAGVDRDELFVTTKAWWENLSADGVRRSLEGSLHRLGTDFIDLWLVHWPNPGIPLEETLAAMQEQVDGGRVRLLGVSNFPPRLFRKAAAIAPIACNQVEYHPYLSQFHLLAALREHGAFLTAYAPVAEGRVAEDPVLQRIGERHGKTAAQTALRWLVQQDDVVAIPKAAGPVHARENLDVFDFRLADQEMKAIHDLARGERLVDPAFAPDWSER